MQEDKRELTLLSVQERQTEKGELSYEQYIYMREYRKANIEASMSDTSHATPVADFVSLYITFEIIASSHSLMSICCAVAN